MMQRICAKLTFANVVSCIALFIALGGASYAATHLAKNSVGAKQLKKNAVATAKIKKGAVTTAKIKKGAVTGGSIAANTVTGANINAPSTPFTQAVARLHSSAQAEMGGEPTIIPLGSYTQPAGQDNQLIGAITVTFKASCEGERDAEALLLENPPAKFTELNLESIVALAAVRGEGKGAAATKQTEFASGALEGLGGGLNLVAPPAPVTRSYGVIPIEGTCKTGSGIIFSNPQLDILGTS
jgi:hypothetical protein